MNDFGFCGQNKSKKLVKAIEVAKTINDRAWRKACVEWLQRRQK